MNQTSTTPRPAPLPEIAILTGGRDRPYALGLAASLIEQGVAFDFIGSDGVDGPELHQSPRVRFFNLRGDQRSDVGFRVKAIRVVKYYLRLLGYAWSAEAKVFHILWNNKIEYLDRTLLLIYYRVLGKRLVLTAHNVNSRKRDGNNTWINRATLRLQYKLADHVFVHTEKMREELQTDFPSTVGKNSVIPFGLNSTVPDTALTSEEARKALGLAREEKVLLFYGFIAPYKGLEFLIEAIRLLSSAGQTYKLIIAGAVKSDQAYWQSIQEQIDHAGLRSSVLERIAFIPDADTEIYFKAADVFVLPYKHIFQSGVLFLGYNFGLPVIATDVGSLRDEIVEGKTGHICESESATDLSRAINTYFSGELYRELGVQRRAIREYAQASHSWTKVAEITKEVYARAQRR